MGKGSYEPDGTLMNIDTRSGRTLPVDVVRGVFVQQMATVKTLPGQRPGGTEATPRHRAVAKKPNWT